MPTINMKETLTNQELLAELEKRVENGAIKIEYENQAQEAPNSSSSRLINNKMVLSLGIVLLMGLWFYYSQKKTLAVQTTIKINENEKNPLSWVIPQNKINNYERRK